MVHISPSRFGLHKCTGEEREKLEKENRARGNCTFRLPTHFRYHVPEGRRKKECKKNQCFQLPPSLVLTNPNASECEEKRVRKKNEGRRGGSSSLLLSAIER